jgi:hypothetical protein
MAGGNKLQQGLPAHWYFDPAQVDVSKRVVSKPLSAIKK